MSLFDDLPEPSTEENQKSNHDIETINECDEPLTVSSSVRLSYFAIFDGHGGSKASSYAAKWLHYQIAVRFPRSGIKQVEKNIKRVLYDAYKKTDEDFLREACQQRPHWRDGSTAASVLLVNNTIYVANLGDSKVVLGRSMDSSDSDVSNHLSTDASSNKSVCHKLQAICLTRDHNPIDYEERLRIQSTGATVQNGRINNILEVSRSFGDYQFKKQGVTCIPDVKKCEITDQDKFLLIACDGLWKSFPPDEAVSLTDRLLAKEIENRLSENSTKDPQDSLNTTSDCILTQRNLDNVCLQLVNEAVIRMSGDNVSCILVVFPKAYDKNFNSNAVPNDENIDIVKSTSHNGKHKHALDESSNGDDNNDNNNNDDDDDNDEPVNKITRVS